jgi:uncharacterized membrane protein required for colicin V production
LYHEELTMGLDLALGAVILINAFRGWFRGFVRQAIRIGGLIACVYLADPVRDYAKPRILPYLPTIQPELVDRLLWWVSAVVTYVVLVGVVSLIVSMNQRTEVPGLPQVSRNDQFAGFLFGLLKGMVIAVFVTAGVQAYALSHIQNVAWASEQAKSSWALKWNEQYQPVAKIWNSQPVRHFVNHVRRMGLQDPAEFSQPAGDNKQRDADSPPVQTANRTPDIEIDGSRRPDGELGQSGSSSSSGRVKYHLLDPDLAKAAEAVKPESRSTEPADERN